MHSSHPANPPRFFDAPVSGGTAGAYKGNLTFMLGAPSDHPLLPVLHEVFMTMGNTVHAMGGPSLGLAGKLSNNYLSGIIALATSEAMNLGMRLGVDPKRLKECFQTSSGANYVNDTTNPVPGVCPDAVTSRGYEPGFKVCRFVFLLVYMLFDLNIGSADEERYGLGDYGCGRGGCEDGSL